MLFSYLIFLIFILIITSFFFTILNNNFKIRFKFHFDFYIIIFIIIILFLFIFFMKNIYTMFNLNSTNNLLIFTFDFYIFPFFFVFILITIISLLFCLSYNKEELNSFLIYVFVIIISGIGLFIVDNFFYFFIFYEFLLIPSFLILYNYSKTRKSVEAAYLMFFWTQFGAIFLFFNFIFIYFISNTNQFSKLYYYNFTQFEINIIFFFFLFGFGVKLPIWPFYDWLPKAHVEASTNFSIFLSGVLVKFAFFGFFKVLILLNLNINFLIVIPYLIIGIVDSVFKLYIQLDIKKIIAYATVAEMHWLLICILSGQSILWLSGFAMLISHAIISTNSFLLVDSITRRFKTRLINEISGIGFILPKLFLVTIINLIIFLGFPGSLFFISEFLFFAFLFELFPIIAFIILLFIYILLAIFFFKSWLNLLFSSFSIKIYCIPLDLNKSELFIYSFLIFLVFWLGNTWQSFIF